MVVIFLIVIHISYIQNNCREIFYNCQRIQEVEKLGKGCFCLVHETRISKMVIKFSLAIFYKNIYDDSDDINPKEFQMEIFSINQLILMLIDRVFTLNIKWGKFDNTEFLRVCKIVSFELLIILICIKSFLR